jgi:hypothetical protein
MVSNFRTFENSFEHKSKDALDIGVANGKGRKSKV